MTPVPHSPPSGATPGRPNGSLEVACHSVPIGPSAIASHAWTQICGFFTHSLGPKMSGRKWQFLRGVSCHSAVRLTARGTRQSGDSQPANKPPKSLLSSVYLYGIAQRRPPKKLWDSRDNGVDMPTSHLRPLSDVLLKAGRKNPPAGPVPGLAKRMAQESGTIWFLCHVLFDTFAR